MATASGFRLPIESNSLEVLISHQPSMEQVCQMLKIIDGGEGMTAPEGRFIAKLNYLNRHLNNGAPMTPLIRLNYALMMYAAVTTKSELAEFLSGESRGLQLAAEKGFILDLAQRARENCVATLQTVLRAELQGILHHLAHELMVILITTARVGLGKVNTYTLDEIIESHTAPQKRGGRKTKKHPVRPKRGAKNTRKRKSKAKCRTVTKKKRSHKTRHSRRKMKGGRLHMTAF